MEVARFHLSSAACSVQLPDGLLESGKDYTLRLKASSSPGVDLSSASVTNASTAHAPAGAAQRVRMPVVVSATSSGS